jgi:hypothetical protein
LSSIFLGETGDSYIASEGYDIKKHRINHRLLTNQSSIFCRHWLLKAAISLSAFHFMREHKVKGYIELVAAHGEHLTLLWL